MPPTPKPKNLSPETLFAMIAMRDRLRDRLNRLYRSVEKVSADIAAIDEVLAGS